MSLLMQQQQQRWAAAAGATPRQRQHMPLTSRATPRPSPAPVAAAVASAVLPPPLRRARNPLGSHRRAPARAAATTSATPASLADAADELPSEVDVVIVGAGLAGLAAARALLAGKNAAGGAAGAASASNAKPLSVLVLEASDGVGGRARTDVHPDGFLLDRGFHIFLTGYPECRDVLDYAGLDLKPFYAGALVRIAGAWHRVADPFRHPIDGLLSLLPSNAVGSPLDKVNVGLFRLKCVLGGSLEALLAAEPERPTRERLAAEGFSEAMVGRFFRPFLGGIFFDRSLGVSDRLFAFVMRMLATGSNCLPARGIGAMGEQMAAALPPRTVWVGARVEGVEREAGGGGRARVRVARGGGGAPGAPVAVVTARRAVVVASEGPEARRLIAGALASSGGGEGGGSEAAALLPPSLGPPALGAPLGVGTACLYFDAPLDAVPSGEPILYLNGGLTGPADAALVNNCCFPSTVAPSYAPAGRHLVSVSTIGTRPDLDDAALEAGARRELGAWFGADKVAAWRHLRTYRIPYAQPPQAPPTNLRRPVAVEGARGLFACGDHLDTATFDGALLSGRRAAEAVMAMT